MYYSVWDVQFWLFGLLSGVSFIVSCYFPGWLLSSKLQLPSKVAEVALSCVIGLVLFAIQAVVFGYLQIRFATLIYLAVATLGVYRNRKKLYHSLQQSWNELKNTKKVIILAVIFSVILQLYAHVGSGFSTTEGVSFYFVNSVDGVMHLSYIQSMADEFPPMEPGFAGKPLENYHYWGDLVLSEFHRVWGIPVTHLFFQYFPSILIILTTVLLLLLIKVLKGTTATALLGVFLLTFGSDAAFLVAQYLNGNWGASIAALDTGVSFIFNMPQVFARVVLLAVLLLIHDWLKVRKTLTLLVIITLGASLFGFKVYYGLYFITGFAFMTAYLLGREFFTALQRKNTAVTAATLTLQQNKAFLSSWLLLLLFSAAVFLPTNSGSGGLFLEPLAWSKKLLSADHFNYQEWFLRMQVYESTGNLKSIVLYNLLAIGITLLSIYGARCIGIITSPRVAKLFPTALLTFIIPANIVFITIGFLFLQTTGTLNIFNFLITPILSINLIAAFNVSLLKNTALKLTLAVMVVALCLPRTVLQLHEYFSRYHHQEADQVITYQELELLDYIKSLPPGVVQADLNNSYERSTPYVSFFTAHPTYLAGNDLLKMDNSGIDVREQQLLRLFSSTTAEELSHQMRSLDIAYLYLTDTEVIENAINILVNSTAITIEKQNQAGMILSVTE